MSKPKNARFWVYINDTWSKITLKPDQSLSWGKCGPTDEGWNSECEQWEYHANSQTIRADWETDGRDCDGRLTRTGTSTCHLERLRHDATYDDETFNGKLIMRPDWKKLSSRQRDEYAEAMNY